VIYLTEIDPVSFKQIPEQCRYVGITNRVC